MIKKFWFYFLLLITCIYLSFNKHHRGGQDVIWSDSEGYYIYLPAVFIYGGFENIPTQSGQLQKFPGSNKIFTKYTCGVAIMQLPFFLVTHFLSAIFNMDTSGFSYWYRVSVMMAAVFYLIAGLILLTKLLEPYLSRLNILITCFLLLAATNIYYYTIDEAGMSHIYSFFLFSLFLYFLPKVISIPSIKNIFLLSLLSGIITLIRPTNVIILFLIPFYNVKNLESIKYRLNSFLNDWRKWFAIFIGFIIPFFPQFIYWKYTTGHFIYYSYEDQGFIYWNNPKILSVLFGVWNGWIIYTPFALFMLVGLFISLRNNNSKVILLIIILATYLFASWFCWWFGGAFGARSYIEYYALLAIPTAFLIERINKINNSILRCSIYFILLASCYYNIRLTYLYDPPWDGIGWTWQSFGNVLSNLYTF